MLAYNHLGLLGRLGNQMFQYAALRGIAARRGYDFGIPPSDFKNEWDEHQLFETFDLPHLDIKNVRMLDQGHAPLAKKFSLNLIKGCLISVPTMFLYGDSFSLKNTLHILLIVFVNDFTFKFNILTACEEVFKTWDNPVSLHVRRTDYLQNSANHYNLGLDYYEKFLKIMMEELFLSSLMIQHGVLSKSYLKVIASVFLRQRQSI